MRTTLMLVCFLLWNVPGQAQPQSAKAEKVGRAAFATWKTVCEKLPSNRALGEQMPPRNLLPIQEFAEIDSALTEFFQQSKGGLLGQTNLWVGENPSANA